MTRETPMIKQYREIKAQNEDKVLLFRVGDFYEMFYEDAKLGARVLEITLTSRETGKGHFVPLAGFPYHALETYLSKLIQKGYKVAICEQTEDPKKAKGLVKREIVRIITPGTVTEAALLDEKSNNYLLSVYLSRGVFGLAAVDVSTGELSLTEFRGNRAERQLFDEIVRLVPAELLISGNVAELDALIREVKLHNPNLAIKVGDENYFMTRKAESVLLGQYNVSSVEALGCGGISKAVVAAGAAITYLRENRQGEMAHLKMPRIYSPAGYMALDAASRRNLELTRTIRDEKKYGSLYWVLDKTRTAMGGRLLRQWLEQPLLDVEAINRRLDMVEALYGTVTACDMLSELLEEVYDLERLLGRIHCGNANARDLAALRSSLQVIPKIRDTLRSGQNPQLDEMAQAIPQMDELYFYLQTAIVEDPPFSLREGGIIADGFNLELDRLRKACEDGQSYILELEAREKERTGIKSLKVGFNKVFGYYIEVTRANSHMVPGDYIRKQTLANAERFLTPELKEYEELVMGARDKICSLEYDLFLEVRDYVTEFTASIQTAAEALARLDACLSLATVARENRYVRPEVTEDTVIRIAEGRHPVVEKVLKDRLFVANDTYLDGKTHRIMVVTGPNMAGKSTYMRQVALIVLMAQVGSFVPARSALIGVADRIYTRIGAADDLVGGQSTFMLEMSEVANILNGATEKSLVLLDEVGRGTSTLDGISIARAVVEYLQKKVKARTLFATHFHELTSLADEYDGIKNMATAVKEKGEEIVFLHKVIEGSVDKSYGIQVAQLAGLPPKVIDRAREILAGLDGAAAQKEVAASRQEPVQMQLFVPDNEVLNCLDELKNMDIMTTTPLEAMQILYRLQSALKKGDWPHGTDTAS